MKSHIRLWIALFAVLVTASYLAASGTAGIYCVVTKVVFEPNEKSPERLLIFGAFTLVDGGIASNGPTLKPQRGYLYFTLSGKESQTEKAAILKEWNDFKTIAGTGQAAAFGHLNYFGPFSDELVSGHDGKPGYTLYEIFIRSESVAPSKPNPYLTNFGLTKLSATGNLGMIVKKLQDALVR